MPRILATLFVSLLLATVATAGTITSISPTSFKLNSGEQWLSINGSGLGSTAVFDGPAGHFELPINASFTSQVVTWVPEQVIQRSGTYTVYLLGGTGTSNSVSFTVAGQKYPSLAVHVPEILLVRARSLRGEYVKFDVTASGGADPSPVIKCDHDSGGFYYFGDTVVTCTATNIYGDSSRDSFTISVRDMDPPNITVPANISVKAQSREGAYVDFKATAYDDLRGEIIPDCSPKPGSLFPLGRTTVQCVASDADLNDAIGAFIVEVVDADLNPFTLHPPEDPVIGDAIDPKGGYINYTVDVTGSLDSAPVVRCDPASGSYLPIGTTTVYCSASDSFGNFDEIKFEATVADLTAPEVRGVFPSPDLVMMTDRLFNVDVKVDLADTVDFSPVCQITTITANEETTSFDEDPKYYDWRITGAMSAELRAELNNKIDPRQYRLQINCTDRSGNSTNTVGYVAVTADGRPAPIKLLNPKRRASGRR